MSPQSRFAGNEQLKSPLTWHYVGVGVLIVLVAGARGAVGNGLGCYQRPLKRRIGQQADRTTIARYADNSAARTG